MWHCFAVFRTFAALFEYESSGRSKASFQCVWAIGRFHEHTLVKGGFCEGSKGTGGLWGTAMRGPKSVAACENAGVTAVEEFRTYYLPFGG